MENRSEPYSPYSQALAQILVLIALTIAPVQAWASQGPAQAAVLAQNTVPPCAETLQDVRYVGSFVVPGATTPDGNSAGDTFRIEIGPNPSRTPSGLIHSKTTGRWMARVTALNPNGASQCVASCEIAPRTGLQSAFKPETLDLSCHGAGLGMLKSRAQVLWSNSSNGPRLRFGSWLEGYADFALKTELDRIPSLRREQKIGPNLVSLESQSLPNSP